MSPEQVVLPYSTWPSPISTSGVARSGLRLGFPTTLGEEVWWTEDRPTEGGRTTIVHRSADGTHRELLAAPWSARTRVHEYGGRSYAVVPGEGVVFTNFGDQRIYLLAPGAEPRPITPEPELRAGLRYAEMTVHDGLIWCVRERHHPDGRVSRSIVSIPLHGEAEPRERVSGSDFYASLTISPDGEHLAFVCWNHPRMPWNGTELRVARLSDGSSWTVKGGSAESVLAPQWRDERHLYLISDWSGWWNLYQVEIHGTASQALYPVEEEFAGPLWQLGALPYAVLADGSLAVLHGQGDLRLGVFDPGSGVLSDLDVPYDGWDPVLATDGHSLVAIGYGPALPRSIVRVDTMTGQVEELRRDVDVLPDTAYLPRPQAVEIEGRFGRPVHAFVYPPSNPRARGEGAPPYVVFVHGGPTGHSTSALDLEKAFFTSRGIGVLDLNYGGSTGYGRAYRERLRRQWGVVDVEDSIAAAEWLAGEGLADPGRNRDPGRQRGRLDGHGGLLRVQRVRRRRLLLRGELAPPVQRDHPRFRVPLRRVAGRPRRSRPVRLTRTPRAGRRGDLPHAAPAGPVRPGGSPRPVPGLRRRPRRTRCPLHLPHLRGRGPRLPPSRDPQRGPGHRARLLPADSPDSSAPADLAGPPAGASRPRAGARLHAA